VPTFVDTNVAIYALGQDSDKKARARQILDATPIASSQVINEAISVLMSKQRFGREEAYEVADALMKLVAVAPVTVNTVRDAMTVGLRYGLNHWDSLIVAAALASGCDTLYSEDMQDGQVFEDRLTVKNPFAALP
jgi:predicted nucleic acid-binding protein